MGTMVYKLVQQLKRYLEEEGKSPFLSIYQPLSLAFPLVFLYT